MHQNKYLIWNFFYKITGITVLKFKNQMNLWWHQCEIVKHNFFKQKLYNAIAHKIKRYSLNIIYSNSNELEP